MTVQELIEELKNAPLDAEVLYVHNKYGRITIDTVEIKEEHTLAGENYNTVTFSGSFEEE